MRTTIIVEATFSSVRLRTDASVASGAWSEPQAIIWKILQVTEQSWWKLDAPQLLPLVAAGNVKMW
ncbi:MAG TPA: hypothetical protein VN666_18955 [Nitrospira sp.]|nr:hypothetical protein [Nitrospira sp.]